MTVPSGSEDTASSDDVYSSVPDTSSDNNDTLDARKEKLYHKGDKLGPLPAVPKTHPKKVSDKTKSTDDKNMDENNNKPLKGAKYNIHDGNKIWKKFLAN